MASVKTFGQPQNIKRNQGRDKMVAAKGKNTTGLNQVSEDSCTLRSVGVRNFKVYEESEMVKTDCDSTRRKSVTVNKGVNLKSSQGVLNGMDKSKGKRISTASVNVGRKALADVSNVQGNSSRNAVHDGPKPMKGKTERNTSLKRVSVGPGGRTVNVSSRKSFMGKVQENTSQRADGLHTARRVNVKDLKASSDGYRTKTVGRNRDSFDTESRTTRNSLIPRKSLPVLKKLNQADTSNAKENGESSGNAKEGSWCPVAKVGKKVASRVSNGRSHLWKSRVSDGFIIMGKTNVDSRAFSRKSIKPTVRTTLQVAQRSSKSKCTSDLNKTTSVAAISSKNKEKATQGQSIVPGKISLVIPHEATQGQLPSDGIGNPSTNVSEIISRRKSDRRRSYTSLLMARSKLLEECGEVMNQEKLPRIDDSCNQLEVAEYVDEIYHYYWVTEAQDPSLARYTSIQTEITPHMRGILINWLIEVHFKFELMQETLYLMVTLLDRYFSQATVKKDEIQLVGLTALLLASKYEDFWHPRVKDLISISAESYTRDQMLGMERLILKELKFRLNVATPYVFMLRFLKAAQSNTQNMKLEYLAFYLIELCLVEYEALRFKPSLLCGSAIYVARCTLQMTPAWTPLLCKHARYEESQLRDCAEMILSFHKAAGTGQLRVTYEKYTRPDLGGVAATKPLDMLPL